MDWTMDAKRDARRRTDRKLKQHGATVQNLESVDVWNLTDGGRPTAPLSESL